MKRSRIAGLAVLLLIIGAYGWWQYGARVVPEGQAPLAQMDLAALRDEFNRAAGDARIVLLLSPT